MFKVKGDRAQWQVVYERLRTMEPDEIVEDSELFRLLPGISESSMRAAYRRALKEVERELSRSLVRVRGIGYRMIQSVETYDVARHDKRRVNRAMGRTARRAGAYREDELSASDRRRLLDLETHYRKLDIALRNQDARLAFVEKDSVRHDERLERVESLLEKHGFH